MRAPSGDHGELRAPVGLLGVVVQQLAGRSLDVGIPLALTNSYHCSRLAQVWRSITLDDVPEQPEGCVLSHGHHDPIAGVRTTLFVF